MATVPDQLSLLTDPSGFTVAAGALAALLCLLVGIAIGYRYGSRVALFGRQSGLERLSYHEWLGNTAWEVRSAAGGGPVELHKLTWLQFGSRLVGRLQWATGGEMQLEGIISGRRILCLVVDPVRPRDRLGSWLLELSDSHHGWYGYECRYLADSSAVAVRQLSAVRCAPLSPGQRSLSAGLPNDNTGCDVAT